MRLQCVECAVGQMSSDGLQCTLCPPGTFGQLKGQRDCQPCPLDTYSSSSGSSSCSLCSAIAPTLVTASPQTNSAAGCVCRDGYLLLPDTNTCGVCDTNGFDCANVTGGGGGGVPGAAVVGLTLPTVALLPGYWRTSVNSTVAVPCLRAGVCVGGMTSAGRQGADSVCRQYHTGPLCELCVPGTSADSNGICGPCSATVYFELSSFGIVVIVAVGVLVIGLMVWWCMSPPHTPSSSSVGMRLPKAADIGIVLTFLQMEGFILSEYDIPFSTGVRSTGSGAAQLNLSLFSFFQRTCKAASVGYVNPVDSLTSKWSVHAHISHALHPLLLSPPASTSGFASTRRWW